MSQIPPFNPGDRIVRTGPSVPDENMYRGHAYTVASIWYCCPKAGWRLTVVECATGEIRVCLFCGLSAPGYQAKWFTRPAELSDYTAESLLEELETPEPAHIRQYPLTPAECYSITPKTTTMTNDITWTYEQLVDLQAQRWERMARWRRIGQEQAGCTLADAKSILEVKHRFMQEELRLLRRGKQQLQEYEAQLFNHQKQAP